MADTTGVGRTNRKGNEMDTNEYQQISRNVDARLDPSVTATTGW